MSRYDENDGLDDLEVYCTKKGGKFYRIVRGNIYCSLAWTKKIECKYCSKEPDHNGLYTCLYEPYEKLRNFIYNKN